jgi:hypothetical protein
MDSGLRRDDEARRESRDRERPVKAPAAALSYIDAS